MSDDNDDPEFKDCIEKNNFKKCSNCLAVVEKIDG